MDYNIHKMCRICLEEGIHTSIFNTDFQMMPAEMIMLCAKIKVSKIDGLPAVICNNCIYRLGVAYHFKQQCENSDIRLRQYLGVIDKGFCLRDAETMTDSSWLQTKTEENNDKKNLKKSKSRSGRYKRKNPEERKKRGPKPQTKVPQTCFHCNKTFKCLAQLQMHIRIHTGERPFICSFCNRRFAQKHNLAIHARVHTGEKPFQCEICSKQFSAMGNFQAHKKIHSGVRDQICQICNKGFISSSDLARHMITHTGIKNFHCDTCGKAFSRNRDMFAHKKKVHLNERLTDDFKCPECHKVFGSSASLTIHFKTHGVTELVQPSVQTLVPPSSLSLLPAPTPLNGGLSSSLGPSSLGIGLHPGFSQGSLSMHPQRLHQY